MKLPSLSDKQVLFLIGLVLLIFAFRVYQCYQQKKNGKSKTLPCHLESNGVKNSILITLNIIIIIILLRR